MGNLEAVRNLLGEVCTVAEKAAGLIDDDARKDEYVRLLNQLDDMMLDLEGDCQFLSPSITSQYPFCTMYHTVLLVDAMLHTVDTKPSFAKEVLFYIFESYRDWLDSTS